MRIRKNEYVNHRAYVLVTKYERIYEGFFASQRLLHEKIALLKFHSIFFVSLSIFSEKKHA